MKDSKKTVCTEKAWQRNEEGKNCLKLENENGTNILKVRKTHKMEKKRNFHRENQRRAKKGGRIYVCSYQDRDAVFFIEFFGL